MGFMSFIGWCIFGLIAGAIARLLVRGDQNLGCIGTSLLGIAGSIVGGMLGHVLFGSGDGQFQPAGWIGSIIGAVIVLMAFRALSKR